MRPQTHRVRERFARQTSNGSLFPPIQFSSAGDPISIVDLAIAGIVTAVILQVWRRWVG